MSHGAAALTASLPRALGRTPEEELVLVGVTDLAPAAGVIITVDIGWLLSEDDAEDAAAAVYAAVDQLRRDGARKVAVLIYDDDGSPPDSTPARLGATAVVAAEAAGIGVLDAIAVFDGRWRSYDCINPSCCPPEGTPILEGPTP
jgi:hypothetical protein